VYKKERDEPLEGPRCALLREIIALEGRDVNAFHGVWLGGPADFMAFSKTGSFHKKTLCNLHVR
jgi:hypothetical protein